MTQYVVYETSDGCVVDVQAGLLDTLNTRLVVPLIPIDAAPAPATRLNPVFDIGAAQYVLVTQFMAAVPCHALKRSVTQLDHARDDITAAIDMLTHGF